MCLLDATTYDWIMENGDKSLVSGLGHHKSIQPHTHIWSLSINQTFWKFNIPPTVADSIGPLREMLFLGCLSPVLLRAVCLVRTIVQIS
ncbi:hypothetical protein SAMD00019534_016110, partial [Acytostelium subglobosum LB1]|uniref:hypothetical protein n=1 Tax=Acytostelium subglobosum LB1 TaxID=1410327 RepID=UPI0006451EFF